MIKLIAGLGNPGEKYESTRHNAGFLTIEDLKKTLPVTACSSKFEAEICETHSRDNKVYLLKPKTFMNNSGIPIGEFARFYKMENENVLTIYDDLDLPVGNLRLSIGGSSGGHNGVASVMQNLGENFWRLRVGIGSNREFNLPSETYVLQKFSDDQLEKIKPAIKKAAQICADLIDGRDIEEIKNEIAVFNQTL